MKKGMIILSVLLVLSMFLSGCGPTASGGAVTGPAAGDIFVKVITLEYLQDWGITAGTINPVEGFTRLLIIILLFSLFFWGSMKLPFGKPIAITISLVLAIMTGIFIPGTLLLTIASTYGAVFSAILLGIPIVLLLVAYWFLKEYIWIRVVLLGLTWYVLKVGTESLSNIAYASGGTGAAYQTIIEGVMTWLNFLEWAVLILGIITLAQALFSLSKGGSADVTETAKGFWNMHKERKHRTRTVELNDYQMEKKELRELESAEELGKKTLTLISNIATRHEVETKIESKNLKEFPHDLLKSLQRAKGHYGKVNSRTWRLNKQIEKLRTQMKKSGKDIDEITSLSRNLIKVHKDAFDKLSESIEIVKPLSDLAKKVQGEFPKKAGEYPFPFASAKGPVKMDAAFVQLEKLAMDANSYIEQAKKEQEKAYADIEGVITQSRELGVFD